MDQRAAGRVKPSQLLRGRVQIRRAADGRGFGNLVTAGRSSDAQQKRNPRKMPTRESVRGSLWRSAVMVNARGKACGNVKHVASHSGRKAAKPLHVRLRVVVVSCRVSAQLSSRHGWSQATSCARPIQLNLAFSGCYPGRMGEGPPRLIIGAVVIPRWVPWLVLHGAVARRAGVAVPVVVHW
ncbi:hypothetical protein VFPBJ_09186 [Purpureocillium lilacinum]|uniref:Uncharacterized protein n=1 Tax=Purpureocillium lilacinum TaxID=33203 RepID=A0A179GCU3_PURLI|nr:hypothetical protein VFPBJ_09186 [Purpureocillium lilacinum]